MAKKKKAAKKKPAPKPQTVGKQAQTAREKALLSQFLLAKELGTSIRTIMAIEQDIPNKRTEMLQAICDITGHRITIEPRGV